MDPLKQIRKLLETYPLANVVDEGHRTEVVPEDESGFPVSFYHHGREFTVGYAGWHDTLSDAERAFQCFAFGLSTDCRLLVTSRGSFEYHWVVQRLLDGTWTKLDELGLL